MPETPERTTSSIEPTVSARRNASSFSDVPVSWIVYESPVTSTIWPRKISQVRFTSGRAGPAALTFTSSSSRSRKSPSVRSTTFTTSISRFKCFVTCSMTAGSPRVVSVTRDRVSSSVGATESVSML